MLMTALADISLYCCSLVSTAIAVELTFGACCVTPSALAVTVHALACRREWLEIMEQERPDVVVPHPMPWEHMAACQTAEEHIAWLRTTLIPLRSISFPAFRGYCSPYSAAIWAAAELARSSNMLAASARTLEVGYSTWP